jgi:hypothetical protein
VKKAFSIGNSIGYGRPATRFKGNIFQAGSSKMGLFLCPARKIFLIICQQFMSFKTIHHLTPHHKEPLVLQQLSKNPLLQKAIFLQI